LEALGINGSFLLVQIINLIIVYVVVSKWIVSPIIGMLEKRREAIANGLEDARVAAEARANAEKDAAKIIAEAQAKASQVVREATERAEAAGRDVQGAFQAEAAKAREKALADVEDERNRILGDLRGQVAALSISATQKLIGDALDEKRQHSLIDEFFSGVKSGKIVMMEDAKLSGTAAEITRMFLRRPAPRRLPSASTRPFWAAWLSKLAIKSWMAPFPASSKACAQTCANLLDINKT
jgi:F-type H+-transporting ATPase subunit b